jgi:hypothetical protein
VRIDYKRDCPDRFLSENWEEKGGLGFAGNRIQLQEYIIAS